MRTKVAPAGTSSIGRSRGIRSAGGSGPGLGAMLAVAARRSGHRLDVAVAQHVERPPAPEPRVASEHEVDARPGMVLLEGVEDVPDAWQQAVRADLEGWVDVA